MKKLFQHIVALLRNIHFDHQTAFFCFIFLLLFIRLGLYVYKNAANIYYCDAWVINEPFIGKSSLFTLFFHQYGMYFSGIPHIISYLFAHITNFDAKVESWTTVVYLFFSCFIAWKIIKRGKSFSFFDIIIPISFFSISTHEILVDNPDSKYGGFPILILFLFCYINGSTWNLKRIMLNIFCFIALLYSGYGYFAIPGIYLFLTHEVLKNRTSNVERHSTFTYFCLICFAVLFLYLFNYTYVLETSASVIHQESIMSLFAYVIHFIGNFFFAYKPIPFAISDIIIFIIILSFTIYSIHLLLYRKTTTSFVPFVCILYTLVFIAMNTAIRGSYGIIYTEASRYRIQFIPLIFGLYVLIRQTNIPFIKFTLSFLLLLSLFVSEARVNTGGRDGFSLGKLQKESIKSCVQKDISIDICETKTNFFLRCSKDHVTQYPDTMNFINYLKEHQANLYAK